MPFQVNEGLASIGIDGPPSTSAWSSCRGRRSGRPPRHRGMLPEDLDPATRVRLRVEQISAVEHATVVGTPGPRSGRPAVLTAGRGRPLILSTLEPAEAMQLLSGGRNRAMVVAILLVGGLALLGRRAPVGVDPGVAG